MENQTPRRAIVNRKRQKKRGKMSKAQTIRRAIEKFDKESSSTTSNTLCSKNFKLPSLNLVNTKENGNNTQDADVELNKKLTSFLKKHSRSKNFKYCAKEKFQKRNGKLWKWRVLPKSVCYKVISKTSPYRVLILKGQNGKSTNELSSHFSDMCKFCPSNCVCVKMKDSKFESFILNRFPHLQSRNYQLRYMKKCALAPKRRTFSPSNNNFLVVPMESDNKIPKPISANNSDRISEKLGKTNLKGCSTNKITSHDQEFSNSANLTDIVAACSNKWLSFLPSSEKKQLLKQVIPSKPIEPFKDVEKTCSATWFTYLPKKEILQNKHNCHSSRKPEHSNNHSTLQVSSPSKRKSEVNGRYSDECLSSSTDKVIDGLTNKKDDKLSQISNIDFGSIKETDKTVSVKTNSMSCAALDHSAHSTGTYVLKCNIKQPVVNKSLLPNAHLLGTKDGGSGYNNCKENCVVFPERLSDPRLDPIRLAKRKVQQAKEINLKCVKWANRNSTVNSKLPNSGRSVTNTNVRTLTHTPEDKLKIQPKSTFTNKVTGLPSDPRYKHSKLLSKNHNACNPKTCFSSESMNLKNIHPLCAPQILPSSSKNCDKTITPVIPALLTKRLPQILPSSSKNCDKTITPVIPALLTKRVPQILPSSSKNCDKTITPVIPALLTKRLPQILPSSSKNFDKTVTPALLAKRTISCIVEKEIDEKADVKPKRTKIVSHHQSFSLNKCDASNSSKQVHGAVISVQTSQWYKSFLSKISVKTSNCAIRIPKSEEISFVKTSNCGQITSTQCLLKSEKITNAIQSTSNNPKNKLDHLSSAGFMKMQTAKHLENCTDFLKKSDEISSMESGPRLEHSDVSFISGVSYDKPPSSKVDSCSKTKTPKRIWEENGGKQLITKKIKQNITKMANNTSQSVETYKKFNRKRPSTFFVKERYFIKHNHARKEVCKKILKLKNHKNYSTSKVPQFDFYHHSTVPKKISLFIAECGNGIGISLLVNEKAQCQGHKQHDTKVLNIGLKIIKIPLKLCSKIDWEYCMNIICVEILVVLKDISGPITTMNIFKQFLKNKFVKHLINHSNSGLVGVLKYFAVQVFRLYNSRPSTKSNGNNITVRTITHTKRKCLDYQFNTMVPKCEFSLNLPSGVLSLNFDNFDPYAIPKKSSINNFDVYCKKENVLDEVNYKINISSTILDKNDFQWQNFFQNLNFCFDSNFIKREFIRKGISLQTLDNFNCTTKVLLPKRNEYDFEKNTPPLFTTSRFAQLPETKVCISNFDCQRLQNSHIIKNEKSNVKSVLPSKLNVSYKTCSKFHLKTNMTYKLSNDSIFYDLLHNETSEIKDQVKENIIFLQKSFSLPDTSIHKENGVLCGFSTTNVLEKNVHQNKPKDGLFLTNSTFSVNNTLKMFPPNEKVVDIIDNPPFDNQSNSEISHTKNAIPRFCDINAMKVPTSKETWPKDFETVSLSHRFALKCGSASTSADVIVEGSKINLETTNNVSDMLYDLDSAKENSVLKEGSQLETLPSASCLQTDYSLPNIVRNQAKELDDLFLEKIFHVPSNECLNYDMKAQNSNEYLLTNPTCEMETFLHNKLNLNSHSEKSFLNLKMSANESEKFSSENKNIDASSEIFDVSFQDLDLLKEGGALYQYHKHLKGVDNSLRLNCIEKDKPSCEIETCLNSKPNLNSHSEKRFNLFKSDCCLKNEKKNSSCEICDAAFQDFDLFKESGILYRYYKHLKGVGYHSLNLDGIEKDNNNLSEEMLESYNFLNDQLNYHKSFLRGLVHYASEPGQSSSMEHVKNVALQLEYIEGYELACKGLLL